jgi:uncharacterized glyoxalase superfamily protein PhnB
MPASGYRLTQGDPMTTTALQIRTLVPSLTVNDLKKSIAFYTNGLGFAVIDEFKNGDVVQGVMLDAGGFKFGISQDDFAKGRDRVKGVGIRLYLETEQDLDEIVRRAKAAGIKSIDGPLALPWGPMAISVTDPDGFAMTISKIS